MAKQGDENRRRPGAAEEPEIEKEEAGMEALVPGHRPQLYVNTSPLAGEAEDIIYTETDKYSITPKRFTARSFFSDELTESAEDAPPTNITKEEFLTRQAFLFYRDTYSHESWSSDVHRFGINPHNTAIREVLIRHNETQGQAIKDSGQFTKSKASNASSQGAYTKFVKHVMPTPFECDLVQRALRYLDEDDHKVVLVDTFPRALRSNIDKKLCLGDIEIPAQDQALEVHTVLLYKNEQTGAILVIDPNNPKFSGHLRHMGEYIIVDDSPSEQHKIYLRPKGSTIGPDASDYRECIDICNKLAALLVKDPTIYATHDQIMSSENVRLLSNNPKIVELDAFDVNNPLRIKQVSDLEKMTEINMSLARHNAQFSERIEEEKVRFQEAMEQLEAEHRMMVEQITAENDNSATKLLGQLALDPALLEGHYES